MCESAVDELFQQPPMDVIPLDYDDVAFEESHNAKTVKCWKGERYLITVAFDKHGRVAGKYYERAPNPSIVDRLADWLGF